MRDPQSGWNGVLPIAGVATAALIALIVAVASPVLRSLTTTTMESADAARVLGEARSRFHGQTPLIEVSSSDAVPSVTMHRPPDSRPRKRLEHLVVLAYDPTSRRLIRTNVPLWAVRLGQWRNVVLRTIGRADLQITVEDIERHGPGLIANIHGPGGRDAVLWAE